MRKQCPKCGEMFKKLWPTLRGPMCVGCYDIWLEALIVERDNFDPIEEAKRIQFMYEWDQR